MVLILGFCCCATFPIRPGVKFSVQRYQQKAARKNAWIKKWPANKQMKCSGAKLRSLVHWIIWYIGSGGSRGRGVGSPAMPPPNPAMAPIQLLSSCLTTKHNNTETQLEKCIHCDQLILRNISKIGATRCQILRLKCTKFDFRWGRLQRSPDP